MTREVALTLVLAAVQVLTIRVAQYALPALYFTTSWLFDRRSEVKGGAILFRLAIPFTAGIVTPLILSDHTRAVASASGIVAWFLVLWPIAWAPSLLFPHSRAKPIVALLLVFWVAFALLPIAGVAVTDMARELFREDHHGWGPALMEAVFTGVPITLGTWLLGRAADQRVSFADDEAPEVSDEELDDEAYQPSLQERLHSASHAVPEGLVSLATFALLLIILLKGNRSGHR